MLEGINALVSVYASFIQTLFDLPLIGNFSFGHFCVACLTMYIIIVVYVRKVL